MRPIFGWSLPPGCSLRDIEQSMEEGPCLLCGKSSDDCQCEPCEKCGYVGCINHISNENLLTRLEVLNIQVYSFKQEVERRQLAAAMNCPNCGKKIIPQLEDLTAWCDECKCYVYKGKIVDP